MKYAFLLLPWLLAAQAPDAGLIAHWRFDEGSGNMAADSVSPGERRYIAESGAWLQTYGKYGATLTNTEWTGGVFQHALKFNGQSRGITPAIPTGTAFSVSAWVSPTAEAVNTPYAYLRIAETAYDTGFMLGTDMTGTVYKLIINSGAGSSGACGDAFGCVRGGKPTAGKWQLVTGTFDGATARLYVDGVQVGSDTATAQDRNLPLYIGDYYYAPGHYGWRGGIDDLRLYNRALSVAEVVALYNAAAGARLPPIQISAMKCKESGFLDHGVRAMTCAMQSPNNTAWKGSLQVRLDRPSAPDQPAFYASRGVNMRRDGVWAVTAIGIYHAEASTARVLGVDFYGVGANGVWEHHPQCEPNCKATLVQKLDYPCPELTPCMSGLYPPPLNVTEFRCEVASVDSATRSVTCGVAANQSYYSGTIRVNFDDGTNDSQLVSIEQPYVDGVLSYWGIAAVATTASKVITNVEFVADGPVANWTPETTEPYPPQTRSSQHWLCRAFGWFCR